MQTTLVQVFLAIYHDDLSTVVVTDTQIGYDT